MLPVAPVADEPGLAQPPEVRRDARLRDARHPHQIASRRARARAAARRAAGGSRRRAGSACRRSAARSMHPPIRMSGFNPCRSLECQAAMPAATAMHARRRPKARSPRLREGSVVDVVRKPSSVPHRGRPRCGGDHSSRTTVTGRLEQPTRGLGRAALCAASLRVSSSAPAYVALLRMGFALPPRYRRRGGLLPRRFTLTWRTLSRATARRSLLCCTFLGVTATGRYPASCSVELGLSSRPMPSLAERPRDRRSPVRHRRPKHGPAGAGRADDLCDDASAELSA